MKTLKQIIYLFFLIITLLQTNYLSAQWDTLATGTSSTLQGVKFVNENTGWIIGNAGIIKKTTNSGVSWVMQTSKTLQTLRRITMIDANTGFVCGDSGKILKTTNGGTVWINSNNTSSSIDIYAMDFIDALRGICAGESSTQLKTTNGGTNWTSSTMTGVPLGATIYGIDMTNTNTVFASSNSAGIPLGSKVYKSMNFGSTYSIVFNNLSVGNFNDVRFSNSNTGYAVTTNGSYLRTTNSGSSWTIQSMEKGINRIFFPDSTHGFMCGDDLSKAYSLNGGSNWTIDFNYNASKSLYGISFINSTTGWMSGENGLLIKTTNGGELPQSCNLNNMPWVETNVDVSNCLDIEVDSCGNVYTTGLIINSSDTNILIQKFSSSGYLFWSKSYEGSSGDDAGKVIKLDDAGNIYVAGYITTGSSDKDIILLKYRPDGILDWTENFDTLDVDQEAVDMTIDNLGNVFVAAKSKLAWPLYNYDYQIIKYNSSGNIEWSRRYDDGYDDIPVSIVSTNTNQVVITGTSNNFSNDHRITTLKYGSSGNLQWTNVTEFSAGAAGMTIGNSGNIYIVGSSSTGTLSSDLVIIRYNSNGSLDWVESLDGGVIDYANGITFHSGDIIVTGQALDFFTFNSELITFKYNTSGDRQWLTRYNHLNRGSNTGEDVATDVNGNIYVTGMVNNVSTNNDFAVIKYNSSGVIQKVNVLSGSIQTETGNAVTVDDAGNVFAGGLLNSAGYKSTIVKYASYDFASGSLSLTAFIQGFYDSNADDQVSDSVDIVLRNSFSPYALVDSVRQVINSAGSCLAGFINAQDSTPYYIVIKHRNSIETWSNTTQIFTSGTLSYDFTNSLSQAYGNNLILVDNSPVEFAIFGGDINQDGVVDATDASAIDNDASNFVTGYVNTDVTGDDFVDASDSAIADNNAANFVSKVFP